MRGLSTRELATLADGRDQEFDPADAPATDLIGGRVSASTPRSPRPPWPPTGAYGEPISQLTTDDRLLQREATPLAEQAQEESR